MSSSNKPNYQLKDMPQWEWTEVKQWLTDNNLQSVLTKLEPHSITGYDLFYMTPEQMKSFDISSLLDSNRFKKAIHYEMLKYLKITFAYEGSNYTYQLDFEPNLTAEALANTIAMSLGIKEQVLFLSTQDNKILFPYLKIIELLLIEPDRYRSLKAFNVKDKDNNNYSSSSSLAYNTGLGVNATTALNAFKQSNIPLNVPISNIPNSTSIGTGIGSGPGSVSGSLLPQNGNLMPQSNMPIMPSALSLKYKTNYEEFRLDKDKQDIVDSTNSNSGKLLNKKSEEGLPIPIPSLNTNSNNTDLGIRPPELSFKSKYESELKPSSYMQFKLNQKQQQQQQQQGIQQSNSSIDDTKLNSNFYNKKLATNPMSTYNTNPNIQLQDNSNNNNNKDKDVKDSMDLNNPTTNYIFNSGEIMTYDQMKKTQGKNSIPTGNPSQYSSIPIKDDVQTFNKEPPSYQKFKSNPSLNFNVNTNANNNEVPNQPFKENKDKDEYRRFSSEKRNFRAYGNLNNTAQEEEYQPKAYEKFEKFNNAPLEDFSSEKFNRFSARQGQGQNVNQNHNQTMQPTLKQNDMNQMPSYSSHQLNYDMKENNKKPQSSTVRNTMNNNTPNNQFDNFNLERKPYNHHQIPIQTTSSENDNMEDNQDRV